MAIFHSVFATRRFAVDRDTLGIFGRDTLGMCGGVIAGAGAVLLTARILTSMASVARAEEVRQEHDREMARRARRAREAAEQEHEASKRKPQANVSRPQPPPLDEPGIPRRSVTVRVPATSANLGSGYDVIGMAFDMWSEVTVELADKFEVGEALVEGMLGWWRRWLRRLVAPLALRIFVAFDPPARTHPLHLPALGPLRGRRCRKFRNG